MSGDRRLIPVLTLAMVVVGLSGSSASAAGPGTQNWASGYTEPGTDTAAAVGVSPDGSRVFVTGDSQGTGTGYDYATAAYDAATGATLWTRRYGGTAGGDDHARALAVSPSGSTVFVTGSSISTNGFDGWVTLAYATATGQALWARRYNPTGYDDAYAIGVSPDGAKVFVTGRTEGCCGTGYDSATVAYNAVSGKGLWAQEYNDPGDFNDEAVALAVSPDGSTVFVTGDNQYDYLTLAYDASTGSPLWIRSEARSGRNAAYAIGVSPDGTMVFVTGKSLGGGSSYDAVTIAYDASTGSLVWLDWYNDATDGSDEGDALAVSPDGTSVFVTGPSSGLNGTDYATVAYRATDGAVLWVRRYDGPSNGSDVPSALGVSPDGGTVFVTGFSAGSTTRDDALTVAYSASTGATLWTRRYDGPAHRNDVANALAVSRDGSALFVAGESFDAATGSDYVTIAYDAG
jgi:Tol biopolymer transport system component